MDNIDLGSRLSQVWLRHRDLTRRGLNSRIVFGWIRVEEADMKLPVSHIWIERSKNCRVKVEDPGLSIVVNIIDETIDQVPVRRLEDDGELGDSILTDAKHWYKQGWSLYLKYLKDKHPVEYHVVTTLDKKYAQRHRDKIRGIDENAPMCPCCAEEINRSLNRTHQHRH